MDTNCSLYEKTSYPKVTQKYIFSVKMHKEKQFFFQC